VIVSDAADTAASSYALGGDGSLTLISGPVTNSQGAACWLVISKDGRFAYTANAAATANNISRYSVGPDGSLALMTQVAASTGVHPVDMAISNNGRYLYVISSVSDMIHEFRIGSDGSLTEVGSAGVVATAIGLAAQ
jgi:6-phosphogluconolactonase (cycloisomerase 2 family)